MKLHLLILPTKKCNYGCPHCYAASDLSGQDMSDETYLGILKFIKNNKDLFTRNLTFIGGEAFQNYRILKAAIFQMVAMGFESHVITNGAWLLDEKICDDLFPLIYSMPVFFQISCDPFHAKNKSFPMIMEKLNWCLSEFPGQFSKRCEDYNQAAPLGRGFRLEKKDWLVDHKVLCLSEPILCFMPDGQISFCPSQLIISKCNYNSDINDVLSDRDVFNSTVVKNFGNQPLSVNCMDCANL